MVQLGSQLPLRAKLAALGVWPSDSACACITACRQTMPRAVDTNAVQLPGQIIPELLGLAAWPSTNDLGQASGAALWGVGHRSLSPNRSPRLTHRSMDAASNSPTRQYMGGSNGLDAGEVPVERRQGSSATTVEQCGGTEEDGRSSGREGGESSICRSSRSQSSSSKSCSRSSSQERCLGGHSVQGAIAPGSADAPFSLTRHNAGGLTRASRSRSRGQDGAGHAGDRKKSKGLAPKPAG